MSATAKKSSRADPLLDKDFDSADQYGQKDSESYGNVQDQDDDEEALPPLPDLDENGVAKLFTWSHFGVILQYISVGLYYGFFAGTAFPIFSGLYGLPSVRVKAATNSINIWWSFKTFLACLSDSTPIWGYRRKYYVFFGWILAGIGTLFTALVIGQPTSEDSAFPLIVCFSFITLSYLIADVASDGAVIALALREPVERRGTIQSTIYGCRYIAMIFSGLVITFGFNGKEYKGSFDFGIKLPWYLYVLFGVNALGWIFYWKMADIPNQKQEPYFAVFGKMFERIKLVVVAKIILFSFFVHLFAYVSNAATVDIQRQLCGVTPLWDGLGNQVLSYLAISCAIFFSKKYLLNTSWHLTLSVCIIFMAIGTFIPAVLIDTATFRSPAFAALISLFPTLIQGCFFIVSSLAATEIAEKGVEGITFGLITTINNITLPLTGLISANIVGQFELYDASGRIIRDTASSRMELVKLDSLIFCIQISALFSLALLPKQKKQLKEQVMAGKRNPLLAKIVVSMMIICFLYSVIGNFLLSNESTACLRFIGGKGCHK
jgi:hypothetical protein